MKATLTSKEQMTIHPDMLILENTIMCVILFNMKTASVRQIQHHFSEVLKWIDAGHEVIVTSRNREVAKITSSRKPPSKTVAWPNFIERMPDFHGKSLSQEIVDQRAERI